MAPYAVSLGMLFIRKSPDIFSNANLFLNVITFNCQFHYDKCFIR